jgi:mannose-6-phosphate isomerase-like protein (cupin superfamily)
MKGTPMLDAPIDMLPIDPQADYVNLGHDGRATRVPGGDAFWSLSPSDLDKVGSGWLVSEYEFSADWSTWEMHPNGDEFVYVLAGSVELLLEVDGVVRSVPIVGSGAVIVPRGVWHTAKVRATTRMLHVTLGAGTQTRPAN